ncbi:MAG: hypothetical protein IRY99_01085 [Isosphaeraceae bacterium]|nr:hypothetical protein [Isosphaeraceae bacterium]
MGFSAPSGTNTFVPNSKLSEILTIDWARKPSAFPINRYMQVIPGLDRMIGYYLRLDPSDNARLPNANLDDTLWPDGQPAPQGVDNQRLFTFIQYETRRRNFPYTYGELAAQQSEFDLRKKYASMAAQRAMTARTILAHQALAGASWGSNTAAVDGGLLPSGQNFTNGTEQTPNIKNALLQAAEAVNKSTVGVINPEDLVLVISPNLARKMAISQEIHSYLARNPIALEVLKGSINKKWGLPDELYGFPLVVEDTVVVQSHKPNTDGSYVMPDDVAYLLSLQGGPLGEAAEMPTTSASLVGLFFGSELNTEEFHDPKNKLFEGRVYENYQIQLTSPLSAFRLTAVA